jgi:hypothetical protein
MFYILTIIILLLILGFGLICKFELFDDSKFPQVLPKNAGRQDGDEDYCKTNKGTLDDVNLNETLSNYRPIKIIY